MSHWPRPKQMIILTCQRSGSTALALHFSCALKPWRAPDDHALLLVSSLQLLRSLACSRGCRRIEASKDQFSVLKPTSRIKCWRAGWQAVRKSERRKAVVLSLTLLWTAPQGISIPRVLFRVCSAIYQRSSRILECTSNTRIPWSKAFYFSCVGSMILFSTLTALQLPPGDIPSCLRSVLRQSLRATGAGDPRNLKESNPAFAGVSAVGLSSISPVLTICTVPTRCSDGRKNWLKESKSAAPRSQSVVTGDMEATRAISQADTFSRACTSNELKAEQSADLQKAQVVACKPVHSHERELRGAVGSNGT